MAKNTVRKTFTADGSWTAPAGVTKAKVRSKVLRHPLSLSSCLASTGEVYAWGFNGSGAVGNNSITNVSFPAANLGGRAFKQVQKAGSNQCLLDDLNRAWSVGANTAGQLGDGTVTAKSSPVAVTGNLRFKKISVSNSSFMAGITETGDMYTWGINTHGQLGDGTVVDKSSPVLVSGGLKWVDVSCGISQIHAIAESGSLYGWGRSDQGVLGDGTIVSKSSPVLVLGGLTWKKALSGNALACGITADGQVYCWGNNSFGQLGDSTIVKKSSPVLVSGGLTAKDIFVANLNAALLTEDGDIYCWGFATNGMLGNGTSTPNVSSPVAVTGGLKFSFLSDSSDASTIHALTTDGDLYGWGTNSQSDIGDGTATKRSSPVLVSTGAPIWSATSEIVTAEISVDVTPGTSYSIVVGKSKTKFGSNTLSAFDTSLEIEYEA